MQQQQQQTAHHDAAAAAVAVSHAIQLYVRAYHFFVLFTSQSIDVPQWRATMQQCLK